jgi:hypothetical protein
VSWNRITEEGSYVNLPDNSRTEDYGQTLVIVGVRYDNAGTYQCTGQNEVGYTPLQKSVTMSVDCKYCKGIRETVFINLKFVNTCSENSLAIWRH